MKMLARAAVLLILTSLVGAVAANADTLYIQWSTNGTNWTAYTPFTCAPGPNCFVTTGNQTIGNWNLNIETGTIQNGQANPLSTMDLHTVAASSGGASNLYVQFAVSDVQSPLGLQQFSFTSTANNVDISTQTASALYGTGLSVDGSNVFTLQNPKTIATLPSPGTTGGITNLGGSTNYAVVITEMFTSGGTDGFVSADTKLSIPEPASLTLLGAGLLGFAGFLRKKVVR